MQRSHLNDTTWWVSPLFICTVLEIDIGLIIACMPVLPRLTKAVRETNSYAYAKDFVRSRSHRSGSGSSAKSTGSSHEEAPSEKANSTEQLTGQAKSYAHTHISVDSRV
jgi:hypothetical protein